MKEQKITWGKLTTIEETPSHRLERVEIKPGSVYAGQNTQSIMLCTILSGSCRVILNNRSEIYHTGQIIRIPEMMNFQFENTFHEACIFYNVNFLK